MKIREAIARGEPVTGEEPFNFFLAALFPSDQILCMEYNRVVRDLAGFSVRQTSVNTALGGTLVRVLVVGQYPTGYVPVADVLISKSREYDIPR